MKPFTSAVREELISANPALTPDLVDELEGLLSVRASLDANVDPAEAAKVDRRIAALMGRTPTRHDDVSAPMTAEVREEQAPPSSEIRGTSA